jgi:hypothetical protein
MWDIAKKCDLQKDYFGYYSFFSEAAHAGHIELQEYLEFNAQGTKVETLLYGPSDGDWVDLVALEGAGFLIDAMEISARIFGIRDKRDFGLLFNATLKRTTTWFNVSDICILMRGSKRGVYRLARALK